MICTSYVFFINNPDLKMYRFFKNLLFCDVKMIRSSKKDPVLKLKLKPDPDPNFFLYTSDLQHWQEPVTPLKGPFFGCYFRHRESGSFLFSCLQNGTDVSTLPTPPTHQLPLPVFIGPEFVWGRKRQKAIFSAIYASKLTLQSLLYVSVLPPFDPQQIYQDHDFFNIVVYKKFFLITLQFWMSWYPKRHIPIKKSPLGGSFNTFFYQQTDFRKKMTQNIGNVFLNNKRLPDANQEIHRSSLKNLYTLKKRLGSRNRSVKWIRIRLIILRIPNTGCNCFAWTPYSQF